MERFQITVMANEVAKRVSVGDILMVENITKTTLLGADWCTIEISVVEGQMAGEELYLEAKYELRLFQQKPGIMMEVHEITTIQENMLLMFTISFQNP
jgi:hypothetical protein